MSETLSSLFQKSRGAPVEVDGQMVTGIFKLDLQSKSHRFLIRRISARDRPVQGLRLKAIKGEIFVNGQRHPEIILWADTSPDIVDLSVLSRSGCELRAWNVWRIDDLTQAWVGNAGLLIAQEGNVTTLSCSDGTAEINFSSLVIQLEQLA